MAFEKFILRYPFEMEPKLSIRLSLFLSDFDIFSRYRLFFRSEKIGRQKYASASRLFRSLQARDTQISWLFRSRYHVKRIDSAKRSPTLPAVVRFG